MLGHWLMSTLQAQPSIKSPSWSLLSEAWPCIGIAAISAWNPPTNKNVSSLQQAFIEKNSSVYIIILWIDIPQNCKILFNVRKYNNLMIIRLKQGCCAKNGKFQYHVQTVCFCLFSVLVAFVGAKSSIAEKLIGWIMESKLITVYVQSIKIPK